MKFEITFKTRNNKEVTKVVYGNTYNLKEALKDCRLRRQEVISISGTQET